MKRAFAFRMDETTYRRLRLLEEKFMESRGSLLRRFITREFFDRGLDVFECDEKPGFAEMQDGFPELSLLKKFKDNDDMRED